MATFLAGMKLTPARLNLMADRPVTRLILGADQSHPTSGSGFPVVFGGTSVEVYDTHDFHSTTVNPSRVTPSVPGTYLCQGTVWWASNATGERRAIIARNGTLMAPSERIANLTATPMSVSVQRLIECNGTTDFVELFGWQTSGGALNMLGTGSETSTITCVFEVSLYRSLIN
ncbi:hypothetical protein [Catenuloplanes japonicus]|uniref:hypothetical protein n=1 Tax=Catenuloplanes japonicus TaxID=33876 RepID=UPI0005247A81|nr:hypothetical protein [Catenuloplanes japonicus]